MTLSEQALLYATKAHEGQTRKHSGDPYITHPIAVAEAVKEHTVNEDVIAAAYLHDVVEDCGDCHARIIKDLFGDTTAKLVDLLTKTENQEYLEYLLRIMHHNGGAVLIKRMDLIHNLSTWPDKGSLPDKWRLALYILTY